MRVLIACEESQAVTIAFRELGHEAYSCERKTMKIYIAGPYTKPDPQKNVDEAIDAAERVAALGHVPYIPHLIHYWELRHPHAWRFWMDIDLVWLRTCDALLRIPGESAGADEEVAAARARGMTVYTSVYDIPKAWEDVTDTPRKT